MKPKKAINKRLKSLRNDFRNLILRFKCRNISSELRNILDTSQEEIPVFIVSYNNGIYVKNMTDQLSHFNIKPIIFDNASTHDESLETLRSLHTESKAHIIYSRYNFGHMIGFLQPIYDAMPKVFAYTDPDLQLNENLPHDFLKTLSDLADKYKSFKAGFALTIDDIGDIKDIKLHCLHTHPIRYDKFQSIREFESKHWLYRLQHETLELYASPIDTTFAVYKKSNYLPKLFWTRHRESNKDKTLFRYNQAINNSKTIVFIIKLLSLGYKKS